MASSVKRIITVLPQNMKLLSNPYGRQEASDAKDAEFGTNPTLVDLMSPLPPQVKSTFLDKLPSWKETSKAAVNPDTFLNVNKEEATFHKSSLALEVAESKLKKMEDTDQNNTLIHAKPPQFSMLHGAAITGDKARLMKLLKSSYFDPSLVDLRDKYGRTPLMFSVLGDHFECTDILLKAGAVPSLKDKAGRNALHWAAHHGHVKCLKSLLNSKLSTKWTDGDNGGVTVLHLATRKPGRKCLPLVLKHFNIGKDQINLVDKNKRTALHWAASIGAASYVALLLKNGASPELPDVEGKLALHWAALFDESIGVSNEDMDDPRKCIEHLVDHSPNTINWQDYEGRTPLHLAVANGDLELSEALLATKRCRLNVTDQNSCSALHLAAQLGRSAQVALLLENGASMSVRDSLGATALHHATYLGSVDTVETLMRHPDVHDEPDGKGRTALMWAAAMEDGANLIAILCRHGANLGHKDSQGNTALHIASLNGRLDSVKSLLRMGADSQLPNAFGFTPLVLSAQHGHESIWRILADHCPELLSMADLNGMLSSHWACVRGFPSLLQLQFERKMLIDIPDRFGRTPAMLAASSGNLQCLQVMAEMCDLDARDNSNRTPLHFACQNGHLNVVKFLISRNVYMNGAAARRKLGRNSITVDLVTPLDLAIQNNHPEIAKLLLAKGSALTMEKITRIAVTRIQALYRSYRIRKSFSQHKELLIKHERLRKQRQKNKAEKRVAENAGSFLGRVIEEAHLTHVSAELNG